MNLGCTKKVPLRFQTKKGQEDNRGLCSRKCAKEFYNTLGSLITNRYSKFKFLSLDKEEKKKEKVRQKLNPI